MQKIKVNKRFIIFLAVLVFFLLEVLIFLPMGIKKVFVLHKKKSSFSQKIKNIEIDWPNKEIYKSQKNDLSKEIEEMHDKSILYKQSSTLISFISSKSKEFGVQIRTISPGQLKEYQENLENFKLLPITIKSKSKFHNFVNFLDQLQESKYFIEIKSLDMITDDEDIFIEMEICGLVKEK